MREGLRLRSPTRTAQWWSTSWVDRYALSRPAHVPADTVKGFTLSLARQVLTGHMDDVITTAEHNVRLL